VFGTGKQSRCFGYVGDAVEAILRLVRLDGAVGEVVNIGNDEEITIEGLAALIKERTNSKSPIDYIPYDQAYEPGFEDMAQRVPSVEKLFRLTGYRPTTPLTVIIDQVAADAEAKREASRFVEVQVKRDGFTSRAVRSSTISR
jgi:UDP-glucose 4-epimerase